MYQLLGTRTYQYLAALSATLCILSSEMHFGWTSPSLPHLTKGMYKFIITGHEASWLAVILLVGTIVGAIIAGHLTNVLGRKKVILLTSIPLLSAWLLIGFAKEIKMLYAARFIAGLSCGLSFSAVPMYLGEIAEPQIRGLLASICPVFVVVGILLINILGNYLPIDTTAFASSVFPIILFLTFIWMPESPSFLLQKNLKDDAKITLIRLRGPEEAQKELERINLIIREKLETKTSIFDLFLDKANRKACFVAYGLRSIQQFCGTTALTFYCKSIFEEAEDIIAPSTSVIIYFSIQLIIAFLSIFFVDTVGRKPLMIISISGTAGTLFLLSGYLFLKTYLNVDMTSLQYIPFLSLFLNVASMSVGIRNIPLLVMGEIFSSAVKPIAVCFGTIYYSILGILSAKLFFLTKDYCGLYVPFFIYGLLTFLSTFFVIYVVPETKGLNLEEIQHKLSESSSQNNLC